MNERNWTLFPLPRPMLETIEQLVGPRGSIEQPRDQEVLERMERTNEAT